MPVAGDQRPLNLVLFQEIPDFTQEDLAFGRLRRSRASFSLRRRELMPFHHQEDARRHDNELDEDI